MSNTISAPHQAYHQANLQQEKLPLRLSTQQHLITREHHHQNDGNVPLI